MKILIKKGFRHKTLVDLEGYEYVEVLGDDIVVVKLCETERIAKGYLKCIEMKEARERKAREKKTLQEDHVQYEVDEQLREDAKIETDDEWR